MLGQDGSGDCGHISRDALRSRGNFYKCYAKLWFREGRIEGSKGPATHRAIDAGNLTQLDAAVTWSFKGEVRNSA